MKKKYNFLLITGVLSFYSSMTCIYSPAFRNEINLKQNPVLKRQKKVENINLNPGSYRIQKIEKKEKGEEYLSKDEKKSILDDLFHPFNAKKNKVIYDHPYNATTFQPDHQSKKDILKDDQNKIKSVFLPIYTRGIYLTNNTSRSREKIIHFIEKARIYRLNTFVIDVQDKMIPLEIIKILKKAGIFLVARVVVFEGGLQQREPSNAHMQQILSVIQESAKKGFQEIQLDYIRYADAKKLLRLPLDHKYKIINSILLKSHEIARKNGVYLSATVFGRITLNQNDPIGQKLENFARYTQTIYPMLYPSHYTNDNFRISNPYSTVKEGASNTIERVGNTRVVAYIQGFKMKLKQTGLSMRKYIKRQISACQDAKSDGWIIWNPRNKYDLSFQAISEFQIEEKRLVKAKFSSGY